jgi:hypothetical protein
MADRMVTPLDVLGVQEPVTVATSMAINASNANPWPEGVRYARRRCTRCRSFSFFAAILHSVRACWPLTHEDGDWCSC